MRDNEEEKQIKGILRRAPRRKTPTKQRKNQEKEMNE